MTVARPLFNTLIVHADPERRLPPTARKGSSHTAATTDPDGNSRQGIAFGCGGSRANSGRAAARQVERMLQGKAFLELWVKVRPKWRRDDATLRHVGYGA